MENNINKKEEKKSRAEKVKERALKKIKNNINNIYKNATVQRKMQQKRQLFNIEDGFYNKYSNEIKDVRSIHVLIKFLEEKWIEQSYKDKEATELISALHLRYNISEEMDFVKDKIAAAQMRKNYSEIKTESVKYLRNIMKQFIKGDFFFFWKIKINQQIWQSVISAMLFDVPKEITLKLKESILIDYMPTINDNLQIQINELTRLGDIEYIKTAIKIKQEKFKNKYNNENIKRVSKELE